MVVNFYLLSHPSLGWLNVFSLFPLPCPPPPPQWLLLLTLKLFELHLRYLGHRKYRSWKMYWMTYDLWPKVTAVTLTNKNLIVCRIKCEPLNQSLQKLVAIFPWSSSSPDYILEASFWNPFLANFLKNFWMWFFKVKHSIGHTSGMVGPIDVKWKGGASVGYWVNHMTLTFDLTHDFDL